jgi:hypothetical protein
MSGSWALEIGIHTHVSNYRPPIFAVRHQLTATCGGGLVARAWLCRPSHATRLLQNHCVFNTLYIVRSSLRCSIPISIIGWPLAGSRCNRIVRKTLQWLSFEA